MYNYNVISFAVFERRNLKNLEITRQTSQYQASKIFHSKFSPTKSHQQSECSRTSETQ